MTKQIRLSDRKPIEDMNIARALAKYPELTSLKDPKKILKGSRIKDNRKPYLYLSKDFSANNGYEVIHGDFIEVCKEIPDNSIDCVFTDPPYSKNALYLYDELGKLAVRVLKPGGFLIAYCGNLYINHIHITLTKYLEHYYTHPLKLKMRTQLIFMIRKLQQLQKPIVVYYKPPMRKPEGTINDIIEAGPVEKDLHEWQQDMKSTTELLEFFTNEGDLILDPMCGSGTTLLACKETKRRCIGIDISAEQVAVSKGRLSIPFLKQGRIK